MVPSSVKRFLLIFGEAFYIFFVEEMPVLLKSRGLALIDKCRKLCNIKHQSQLKVLHKLYYSQRRNDIICVVLSGDFDFNIS